MTKIVFILLSIILSTVSHADSIGHRHIAVSAQGEVKVAPDQAKINIRVSFQAKTSINAKQEVDQRVNVFLDAIKQQLNILEKDIIASNIITQPEYDYTRNGRKLLGYRATRNIEVVLNDLDNLNALMDIALKNKLDEIQNIQLESSKKAEMEAKAQEKAVENALAKAKHLSAQFGAKLGPVYSIRSQSSNNFRPVMRAAAMDFQESAASAPGQYIQETITFKANINVVFDLLVGEIQ